MSIFSKIKGRLSRTKENLSRKIYETFKGRKLDDDFFDDLEMALISADLGYETSQSLLEEFRTVCFKEKLTNAEDAKKHLKIIMKNSINYIIDEYDYPLIILVAGVNGVGKTTALGKLAKFFKDQNKSVVLAAADTFRAAATEQLAEWAKRADVRIVKHNQGSDAAAVVYDAISSAKAKKDDVILIDTAGRLQNKKNLMNEISKINRIIARECPDYDYRKLIVLDATTGQNAVSQVEIFNEFIDVDGIILNKLDGTAKGGIIFSICNNYDIPVYYIGLGEQIGDIDKFIPEEFIEEIFDYKE